MIDWNRVDELRSEFGSDGFAEVVSLFLEEADEVVAVLGPGLPPSEVEVRLHFLKGSALNLGFRELAGLCQDGERRAAQGHGGIVDLLPVASSYQRSRDTFLRVMAHNHVA